MNYQWYPGHMTKARRMMQEDIKLIDLVIELLDARIPFSSRNPDIDTMGKDRARLILLNKADLADEKSNEAWVSYFQEKGYCVRKINSRSGAGLKAINTAVLEACHQEPSGACDGSGNTKCRKVNVYQCICRKSMCEDRKQTRCHEGKTVDPPEQESGTSGYTGNFVAEIRRSECRYASCDDWFYKRRNP